MPQDTAQPRRFGRPQLVIREHTNNAVRWKTGERLNHVLEEACIRFSESAAVVTEAGTLSYRELNERSNQLAHFLRAHGVRKGDRVGIFFPKAVESLVAMFGALKAGAVYVP